MAHGFPIAIQGFREAKEMPIFWRPLGSLDIASDPHVLPESQVDGTVVSEAIARIKNLRLNVHGQAILRLGSREAGVAMLTNPANFIIEQDGMRYSFDGSNIYRNEVVISGGASSQWWAILYNQFNDSDQQVFALNGALRKRINGADVFEWGIEPPMAPPALVALGTGLTGTYNVVYTYARFVGGTVVSESNPSPAATEALTVANEGIKVTFTASSDPQVTHVRIYRTLDGGGIFYFDQNVPTGSTTVTSTQGDGALGGEVARNHDRPPLGTIVIGPTYDGVAFIAVGHKLYWCLPRQPEYWPALNFIEVGVPQFPIRAMVMMDGLVYCLTDDAIWMNQGLGDGFNPIRLTGISRTTPNAYSAVPVQGVGLFHVSLDGIYLYRGVRDQKISEQTVDPIFRGESKGGIPIFEGSSSWVHHFGNKVYLHWGDGNLLVFTVDTEKLSYYKYDERLSAPALDRKNGRFLVGDNTRRIRAIEEDGLGDDLGTAIEWDIETKQFGSSVFRTRFEWVKYDVNATDATGVKGELFYDGALHQTHTIVGNRETGFRVIKRGNTRLCSIRLSGTGKAFIHSIAID